MDNSYVYHTRIIILAAICFLVIVVMGDAFRTEDEVCDATMLNNVAAAGDNH